VRQLSVLVMFLIASSCATKSSQPQRPRVEILATSFKDQALMGEGYKKVRCNDPGFDDHICFKDLEFIRLFYYIDELENNLDACKASP